MIWPRRRAPPCTGGFGTCVGQNGTLTAYLIDAVNLVAGKLDRPGGSVFSTLGMPGQRWVIKVMGAGARRAYRAEALAHRRLQAGRRRRAGGVDGQGDHDSG